MKPEIFKEELRAKVIDFAVTHYLIGLSETKSSAVKKKQAEEAYQKLENFILGGIEEIKHPLMSTEAEPIIPSEDQRDLGF